MEARRLTESDSARDDRIDRLFRAFDRSVAELERWEDLAAPTLANRTRKFFAAPWYFPLYQLAKFHPIKVTGRTAWGRPMRGYLPDYFHLARFGILGDPLEARLAKYMIKRLDRNDVFLDVGASCGFYSLLAGFLIGGSATSVHAFEPTPWVFELLAANARGNPAIVANQCALDDKSGSAEFHLHSHAPLANTLADGSKATSTVTVPVVTIDDYCERHRITPTFLKIDVEGAEDRVLAGAVQTLRQSGPVVVVEMFLDYNDAPRRAGETLLGLGYQAHALNRDGRLEPVDVNRKALADLVEGHRTYVNLVFTRPGR